MCGKEGNLFVVQVEGTRLSVCQACSKYGKIIGRVRPPVPPSAKKKTSIPQSRPVKKEEPIEIIVPNYATLIKKKRERLGLKQKEFAQKISERESLLHKIETGSYVPSMELARKLEKALDLRLIEVAKEEQVEVKRSHGEALTMGDFISIKKE